MKIKNKKKKKKKKKKGKIGYFIITNQLYILIKLKFLLNIFIEKLYK